MAPDGDEHPCRLHCGVLWTSSSWMPSASDNCGEVTIEEVSETIAGDCAGSYTITRTFTATDDAGQQHVCHADHHGPGHDST